MPERHLNAIESWTELADAPHVVGGLDAHTRAGQVVSGDGTSDGSDGLLVASPLPTIPVPPLPVVPDGHTVGSGVDGAGVDGIPISAPISNPPPPDMMGDDDGSPATTGGLRDGAPDGGGGRDAVGVGAIERPAMNVPPVPIDGMRSGSGLTPRTLTSNACCRPRSRGALFVASRRTAWTPS